MATPIISSASDSLDAALKAHILPYQEYYLQGSINDDAVKTLLHRLRGLCDNANIDPEKFCERQMCLTLQYAPPPEPSVTVHVRRSLDQSQMPWQVRYIGKPEMADVNQPTLIRHSIDVATSKRILDFLYGMGYKLVYEYDARGYIFRKGLMKIVVSKIFKMTREGLKKRIPEPMTDSYLVEMSVLAPSKLQVIGEEMKSFADLLKPLVNMKKIDYTAPMKFDEN